MKKKIVLYYKKKFMIVFENLIIKRVKKKIKTSIHRAFWDGMGCAKWNDKNIFFFVRSIYFFSSSYLKLPQINKLA